MRSDIPKNYIIKLSILLSLSLNLYTCQSNKNPFQIIKPIPQTYEWLRLGEVKPNGWLLNQMRADLSQGFVGKLDRLVPDLIIHDDIYGRNRLTKAIKNKDVGTIDQGGEWEVQYLWWNSETQSNWWDGFVRNALLTEHLPSLKRVDAYIDRILSYQDEDGYLGIYAPDLRYNFEGENGELWAQSSLFRGLLAYYEVSNDPKVLEAVEKAMQVTMEAYSIRKSTPFKADKSFAGLCHGLTITDALDRLYQLTNKKDYLDYALWLYEDYSRQDVSEKDIQYSNLADSTYKFQGHGVHVYEHLRSLLTAYYASGNPNLKLALEAYQEKLALCLSPSGGPIGDEWIKGNTANASETGYEYCSTHELLDSYSHLLQKTGEMTWADQAEYLLFNAAQGARHPRVSCIAYLKTDNSYSMTGALHPGENSKEAQTRYKYSPVHQDVAVCCVPNAGRIYPYFVKAMWMRSPEGLVAAMYGPCEVNTEVKNTPLKIIEDTNYPFDLDVRFTLNLEKATEFEIALRKPNWAVNYKIQAPGAKIIEEAGLIKVQKVWNDQDQISIQWEAEVQAHQDQQGDYYLTRGPLLYALPLLGQEWITKEYDVPNFYDYKCRSSDIYNYGFVPGSEKKFEWVEDEAFEARKPWLNPAYLLGDLINKDSQQKETVELRPLGSTVLRRVTFVEVPAKVQ